MNKNELNPERLNEDLRDKLVAVGKGVAGIVPFAGGVLAEVIGTVIPGQRADRIAIYLRDLTMKIESMEDDVKNDIARNSEKISLIEEGGFQSAKAISEKRIKFIVEAVSKGLTENDSDILRRKRLLVTLGNLDDDEINLLNAYGRAYGGGDRDAFKNINRPDPVHLQSSLIDFDQKHLFDLGQQRLTQLGLLKKDYGHLKKGEIPDFNPRDGDFKHRLEISYLGRMLLREIGMETPFDAQQVDR